MIRTLAVDGWAATFGTAMRGLGGTAARPGPLAVPYEQPTHQQSVFQLHIIRRGSITFAL